MTEQKGGQDWVALQHKTMARWINSKIDNTVTDLRLDLLDGLVLVKLINKIVQEIADKNPQTKLYCLHPVYEKPKFKLQKYENVNDFLQFLQVVLKINICNISADNIVEGNLKLILGLIWSIFVFSTTNFIASSYEGNSFFKIKEILLEWVNSITHKRGLTKVTNFDRDWSLEINRPDLIFLGILDYYLPLEIRVEPSSKRLQNMTKVFEIAKTLSIPQLADLEDFTLFVPDEKCVVTYVLEWFKVFQLENKFGYLKDYNKELEGELELTTDPESESKNNALNVKSPSDITTSKKENNLTRKVVLDEFIETIIHAVNQKHRYKSKYLLFCNNTNAMTDKMIRNTYYFNDFSIDYLIHSLDEYFEMFSSAYSIREGSFIDDLTKALDKFATIRIKLKILMEILESFESYVSVLKSALLYKNIPELEKILMGINNDLCSIGIEGEYKPPCHLSLASCVQIVSELTGLNEEKFKMNAKAGINKLRNSSLKQINDYLKIVEMNLNESDENEKYKSMKPKIIASLDSIEYLINVSHRLDYFARVLEINPSTSGLKSLLDSTISKQRASHRIDNNLYKTFKAMVKNKALSEAELKSLIQSCISSHFMKAHPTKIHSFMKLIPTCDISIDRSDQSFNILYASDESDDNNSLFEEFQKSKYTEDKVYDVNGFFEKLEGGFRI